MGDLILDLAHFHAIFLPSIQAIVGWGQVTAVLPSYRFITAPKLCSYLLSPAFSGDFRLTLRCNLNLENELCALIPSNKASLSLDQVEFEFSNQ